MVEHSTLRARRTSAHLPSYMGVTVLSQSVPGFHEDGERNFAPPTRHFAPPNRNFAPPTRNFAPPT
eukprot:6329565-Pyramimonas_sp.AAC.1